MPSRTVRFVADRVSDGVAAGPRWVVAGFGLIWLANAAFQFAGWFPDIDDGWTLHGLSGSAIRDGAAARLLTAFAHPALHAPGWLRPILLDVAAAVLRIGPHLVGLGMAAIAALIGTALIAGVATRAVGVIGIAYSLFCWVTLNSLGYPYGGGQTDPGVFIAYAIAFVFVIGVTKAGTNPRLWTIGRLLFGLLWAFDAVLKWQPGFLYHFLDQITGLGANQPALVLAYMGIVVAVVKALGPFAVAVAVAVIESVLALSLLTRWAERLCVPFGLLYSLGVWATAETLGGPYTAFGTGVRGNVLGNVLIYAVIYLFLLVAMLGLRQSSSVRIADEGATA